MCVSHDHDLPAGLVDREIELTDGRVTSDGPGRMTRKRCIDIAAFLLSENGFPAGAGELPAELDALNQIAITRTK